MKTLLFFYLSLLSGTVYGQNELFYLSGNGYSKITDLTDERLQTDTNLVDLYVSNDTPVLLDSILGRVHGLKKLSIHSSSLTTLGNGLVTLKSLQWLHVDCRELLRLPEKIGDLSELTFVILSNSKLTCLPVSFNRLDHLEALFIGESGMKEFPQEIIQLKNGLSQLEFKMDNVESFPQNFCDLKSRGSTRFNTACRIELDHCDKIMYLPENIRAMGFEFVIKDGTALRNLKVINKGDEPFEIWLLDLASKHQLKKLIRSVKNPDNLIFYISLSDIKLPSFRTFYKLNGMKELHIMKGYNVLNDDYKRRLIKGLPNTTTVVH